jgi:hypothetical protein
MSAANFSYYITPIMRWGCFYTNIFGEDTSFFVFALLQANASFIKASSTSIFIRTVNSTFFNAQNRLAIRSPPALLEPQGTQSSSLLLPAGRAESKNIDKIFTK